MPLSTDVNLPRSHIARFPDHCVVCDARSPGRSALLVTGALGWWSWLLWWTGSPVTVRVPACRGCKWRLHGARLASLIFTVALTITVLTWLWPSIGSSVPERWRKLASLGLVGLCLSPWILARVFFPPAFDLTAFAKSIDYEFRSAESARDFAEINRDAEWVKIEDELLS